MNFSLTNTFRNNPVLLPAMLTAFLIPVWKKAVPPSLLILFIVSLIFWKQRKQKPRFYGAILFLALSYVAYLVGMYNTTDWKEGTFTLELKMSMLLIPVYFVFFKGFLVNEVKYIFMSLVAGCFLYAVATIIRALFLYAEVNDTNVFFSALLSPFIHPTYMAMYICVCLLVISVHLISGLKQHEKWLRWFYIVLLPAFSVYVLLLASKGGILGLMITWMFIVFYFFYQRSKWYWGIAAVTLVMSVLVYLVRYPTVTRWKFEKATEIYYMPVDSVIARYKTTTESNAVRRLVWHVSWNCIKNNPWGEGTGDAQNVLHNEFKRQGFTGAYEHKLNCHNQFFETTLAVGVPGLILFLLFIVTSCFHAVKKKKIILFAIIILASVNMLFESMFETQTGVIFITFFACILLSSVDVEPDIKSRP